MLVPTVKTDRQSLSNERDSKPTGKALVVKRHYGKRLDRQSLSNERIGNSNERIGNRE